MGRVFFACTVAVAFLFCNGGKIHAQQKRKTYVYAWEKPKENYSNFIPVVWVGRGRNSDTGFSDEAILKIKKQTDEQPRGHRVILFWKMKRWICFHPDDALKNEDGEVQGITDKKGNFIPYKSIWWENGLDSTRKITRSFFKRYDSVGGKVDVLLSDEEEGLSNWALEERVKDEYGGKKLKDVMAYYHAIAADPRYKKIQKELSFDDIEKVHWYLRGNEYLEWNALMEERKATYFKKALYNQAKNYYPNVKSCNYRNYLTSRRFPVPGFHGHKEYLYRNGTYVGTHQSRDFYGYLGQITNDRKPEGARHFKANSFSSFIYEVNKIRAMRLADPVPVYPWVAYKGYEDRNLCYLNRDDYYQEMIFHLLCTGVDALCFFNPYKLDDGDGAKESDNKVLSSCAAEFDSIMHIPNLEPDVLTDSSLVNWESHFVMSSMSNDSVQIFRFTPKLKSSADFLKMIVSRSPAVFKVDGYTISIPDSEILKVNNASSRNGVWVLRRLPKDEE